MSQLMEEELDPPRVPLPKTPVLLTAATKWEAEPLAKGLGLTRVRDGRFEGTLGGRRVVLVKTGMGAKKTADALEGGFAAADYGVAFSVGLCGAMQPELRTGDLVADAQNVDLDLVVPLRETARSLGLRFHFGKLLHTNVVLAPAAKRKLGAEHRAVACDMETAAVRRWAYEKIPVVGVRAVLDELDETLPADAPEGEDAASLARFALAHAASMPGLIRTGLRSGRAMKNLTRFLKAYLETI
jgi:adenosylhomocysteine nucleosidase